MDLPPPINLEKYDPAKEEDARAVAGLLSGLLFKGADTRSMLGTGYNGGHLVIAREPEYKPGQDVAFRSKNGGVTTHRVEAVKPGYLYTKGINNRRGDGWIKVEDVIGRVMWPKPKM